MLAADVDGNVFIVFTTVIPWTGDVRQAPQMRGPHFRTVHRHRNNSPRRARNRVHHRPRRGAAQAVPRQVSGWAAVRPKAGYAGSFKRKSEAVLRRNLVAGCSPPGSARRSATGCAPTPRHGRHRHRGGKTVVTEQAGHHREHRPHPRRLAPTARPADRDDPVEDLTVDEVAAAIATMADQFKPSTVRKASTCSSRRSTTYR